MHDHAAAQKRYRQSEKGREYQRKFKKSPKGKYDSHKARAKHRGIEWEFTFETWWEMWEPYFDRMGQGRNDMVMCRHGDTGPYSPDNCRIDTHANNTREWAERSKKGGE